MFCTAGLLGCIIFNANLFGTLANTVSELSKKTAEFSEKLDSANTAMKNMRIPDETVKKVYNYLVSTQTTLELQTEMESFLELISPSLRQEVTKNIFSHVVIKNPIFSGNDELINYLVKFLDTSLYLPEDIIIKQGELAEYLFFLARGEVEVFIQDQNNKERYVNTLKLGSYFGEVGLIKDCPRTSTVKSKNYIMTAKLSLNQFKYFKSKYPNIVTKMNDKIIEYQDKWKFYLKQTLRNISFLSHDLSEVIVEDLMYELETDKVEAGNFLFRKGFACDCIYIIVNGELDILMDNNGNGRETFIETLGQSSIIGTYATLKEEDYSYSCKAKTDCNLMYLKFETLELLRGKYEELDYYLLEYESFIEKTGSPF